MNIQEKISKLQTNLAHMEILMDKKAWTREETSRYGNKMMLSVEKDLVDISIKLCVIEFYLDKPSKEWTDDEKDKYGSKECLRKKEEQLRKKEEQLREQEIILLRMKEKTNAGVKMDIDITPEEATKSLIHLIRLDNENKNIFSAQDSMETLNLDKSILNITIKSLDDVPNLLYSEEIYNDEKEIGIEMPIDRLCQIKRKTIVMIGVSGCGKTRTCYDLCRKYWGLYFDSTADADYDVMIRNLELIRPATKTEEAQQVFEQESRRSVECLIATRLLVLQTLRERYPKLEFFEWLCIQRSRRSRNLFFDIFSKLSRLPWSVSSAIYDQLKKKFLEDGGRVIFDECQYMLEHLKLDYRSTKSHQQHITDGRFDFPRSFFSFLSKFIFKGGFNSIWCGTQMRIRNMELLYSAAGGKEDGIYIFTDFNFLKPSHIFKLLGKWLNVNINESNVDLFQEISQILQGRPRFLISFLHKFINSNDIDDSFRSYVKDMTAAKFDSGLSDSSPYIFWKERIDWTIQPIERTNSSAFQTRIISDMLIKLCIAFLFGDGSNMVYSPDFDLVSTGLVMVTKLWNEWRATMAEPIVLIAGLNYLADQEPQILMDYFANQLFSPLGPPNLTPQERGHVMECVIALRFIQGWWLESKLQCYLPQWARDLEIRKPHGIIDCRLQDSNVDMFLQQLRNSNYPWVIFPTVNAGPDLRYSIFCCYIKTTSTRNSQSTIYVDVDECKKNIATMNPRDWYKSQISVQKECLPEIQNKRFIHLRFELPDTAPSMKDNFNCGTKGDDYVICVNLDSTFAQDFFGASFVEKYRKFVSQVLNPY